MVQDGSAVLAVHNGMTFAAENRQLRDSGCLGGLGKVVVTIHEFRGLHHGLSPEVEWALDNAEAIISRECGGLPDLMTMTGEAQ